MSATTRCVAAATTGLALSLVGACGGQSPYCEAVSTQQKALESFGSTKTDAAFTNDVAVLSSIRKLAPTGSKKQWATLAEVTQGVLDAHESVGLRMQDLDDETKRAALSSADIKKLNQSYDAFNGSRAARRGIVADVKKTCDIQLK